MWKLIFQLFLYTFCGVFLFLQGCGDDEASSSGGPTSLAALPKATGAVSGSTSVVLGVRGVGSTVSPVAQTGLKIKDWGW